MRQVLSVVVDRPFDDVAAFMRDPFNMPRLRGSTLAIRQTSPGPVGVGSTFQLRMAVLGFETRLSGAVTEWDWPNALSLSFTGAGIRAGAMRETLEATPQGTKIVRTSEIEPRPAFMPLWLIAWPFVKRRAEAANRNLKRLLEAGPLSPSDGSIDAL